MTLFLDQIQIMFLHDACGLVSTPVGTTPFLTISGSGRINAAEERDVTNVIAKRDAPRCETCLPLNILFHFCIVKA